MKTLLDVHTHTIASGHAFSTLQEMTLTQETIEKRSIFQRPLWVVVFALTAAIAWGWAYPLIKMGMRNFGIQPDMTGSKMLFAGIRFFISGLIILAIAMCFRHFIDIPWVSAMFMGIRPAVVALIAVPTFNMAKSTGICLTNCWICLLYTSDAADE